MAALAELKSYIESTQHAANLTASIAHGELTLLVEATHLPTIIEFLRDDAKLQFHQLISICGADYPERPQRFEVIYHLLSLTLNQRIRVKLSADSQTLVPSLTNLFASAGWYERETWDLYGIYFANHPDLRRILTDYGFEGHPLRKDFPLTGHQEVRYDSAKQAVVYEPVQLSQEFRNFDFTSPWEGTQHILPGDEKATKE